MYDLVGEAIWIFGYGGLGYLFGTQWEVVSDFISNFGGLMFGLVVLVAAGSCWQCDCLRTKLCQDR